MRGTEGLTLLETVVAIAICGVILATMATVATGSLRENRTGNFKIQATQVLDTLGRRIAGGDDPTLIATTGTPIELSSGEITALTNIALTDVMELEAVITNRGTYSIGTTSLARYEIEVCYAAAGAPRCVVGTTLGRRP